MNVEFGKNRHMYPKKQEFLIGFGFLIFVYLSVGFCLDG